MTAICPVYRKKGLTAYVYYKCRCSSCRQLKSNSDRIYRNSHSADLKEKLIKFRLKYPEIIRQWKQADYQKNKQAYINRALARKRTPEGKIENEGYRLKARYQLSHLGRQLLYLKQDGSCGICNSKIAGRNCHIDHDHISGKIRGLLCQKCNMGLGCFEDKINYLYLAADYLERTK